MWEPQFFLPEKHMPSPEALAGWRGERPLLLEQAGKSAAAHCWIFQTWLRLSESGFPCRLVHALPSEGLVITLAGCVPLEFRPPAGMFFVDIVADGYVHSAAQAHVVQNPAQRRVTPRSAFIPLWPQHDIISRDSARGDRVENVCFFGDPQNLAPELRDPAWAAALRDELGIRFEMRGSSRWADYREADIAIAARDFAGHLHLHKPATKLHNAWLAGAPFVCAPESAYLAERRGADDFLVASSAREMTEALRRLKGDPALFHRMRAAAAERAKDCGACAVRLRWEQLFLRDLPPRIEAWQRRGAAQRRFSHHWHRLTLRLRQRLADSPAGSFLLRRSLPR